MVERFTINELIKKGISEIEKGDFNNPLLDVQLLLGYTLNVDRLYIYTHGNDILEEQHVDKFLKLVEQRKSGYPLQYILKKQEFMGLDFFVDEGVLVPRPDTEVLVEKIIDIVEKGYFKDNEPLNILDIGTGSGAITLSLAHYIKNSFVYSVDISKKALEIANKNMMNLELENRVKLLEGDLLDKLDDDFINKFNIIVSNPPYIPSKDIDDLQIEVSKFEPRLALDGGLDGLDFYKRIIDKAPLYLKENGLLAFEIGYNQAKELKNLLVENGCFRDVEIIKDLGSNDRVVVAYRKECEL